MIPDEGDEDDDDDDGEDYQPPPPPPAPPRAPHGGYQAPPNAPRFAVRGRSGGGGGPALGPSRPKALILSPEITPPNLVGVSKQSILRRVFARGLKKSVSVAG